MYNESTGKTLTLGAGAVAKITGHGASERCDSFTGLYLPEGIYMTHVSQ